MTPQDLISKFNFYSTCIDEYKKRIEEAYEGFYLDFKCFLFENRHVFRTIEIARFFRYVIKNNYKSLNKISANIDRSFEKFNVTLNLDWIYRTQEFTLNGQPVTDERVFEYLKDKDLHHLVRKISANLTEVKNVAIKTIHDDEEVGAILILACARDLDLSYEEFMKFVVCEIEKDEYERYKLEAIKSFFIKMISFVSKERSYREIYTYIKERYELSNYLSNREIIESIKVAKTIKILGEL